MVSHTVDSYRPLLHPLLSPVAERENTDQKRSLEGGGDHHERQGTVWTATAHIVTTVIGSGVLALPWSVAQLGWVAGPVTLLGFPIVTYYTSTLLANSYRAPDPITGARNRTYTDAVRSYLGPREVLWCGITQYISLWGCMVGFTITTSSSITAVWQSNCFSRNGHGANCHASRTMLMIVFGAIQVVLSQFPSLEKITWLSVAAAVMSFAYSLIALVLCVGRWISTGYLSGDLTGANDYSSTKRARDVLLSLGNIAFAYKFSEVSIEIQDTLKSSPPENKIMKRAAMNGMVLTTIFYLSIGCIGYAAFGNDAPGNILTGFGFYNPFWLVDIANLCLILHLVGAYQVIAQPIFAVIEKQIASRWPNTKFIHKAYRIKILLGESESLSFTLSKLVLRSALVTVTTLVAMLLPFFNAILGLLGALSFWPLSVYFPVSMHIAQAAINRGTPKWVLLHSLSSFCLIISIASIVASVVDIVQNLKS